MAEDDKRKRRDAHDPFSDVEEGEWADAVDAWDDAFDFAEESAPPADGAEAAQPGESGEQAAAPPTGAQEAGAPASTPDGAQDPLVELIDGEMEVSPEERGQALGPLLGVGSSVGRPSLRVSDAQSDEDVPAPGDAFSAETTGIGIDPESVAPASMEVEIVEPDGAAQAGQPEYEQDIDTVELSPEAVDAAGKIGLEPAPAPEAGQEPSGLLSFDMAEPDETSGDFEAPAAPPGSVAVIAQRVDPDRVDEVVAEVEAAEAFAQALPQGEQTGGGWTDEAEPPQDRAQGALELEAEPPQDRADGVLELEAEPPQDRTDGVLELEAEPPVPEVARVEPPARREDSEADVEAALARITGEVEALRHAPVAIALEAGPEESEGAVAIVDTPPSELRELEPGQVLQEREAPEEEEHPPPPPLEVFDEIVPPPEAPEPEPEPEVAGMGEMLGAPAEPEPIAVSGPNLLEGIEEEAAEEAPAPALELPATLFEVDPTAITPAGREPAEALPPDQLALLGAALEKHTGRVDSVAGAAELQLAVATLAELRGDEEAALNGYREVLQHRPRYVPALQALWRIHARQRDLSRVGELAAELAEALGGEARASLLTACADLSWACAGDDAGARDRLEAAGSGARIPSLLVELDLAVAGGDEDSVREALGRLADVIGEPSMAAALRLELGRSLEQAGRHDEAATAYRRAAALSGDVEHAVAAARGAWEGLIRCGARLDEPAMVAAGLGGSAAQLQEWGPVRRRRLAALVAQRPVAGVDALEQLRAAAEAAPGDPLIVGEWADALQRDGATGEALGAYRQLAELMTEQPLLRTQALVEAALMAEATQEQSAGALELYREAAAISPDYAPAVDAVARLQLDATEPSPRFEAHRAAAEASAGLRRPAHLLAAAWILDEEMDGAERVADELQRVLNLDPACLLALDRLEQLLREQQAYKELVEALDSAAGTFGDAPLVDELRLRAARYLEQQLASPERALERYQQVAQRAPGRIDARRGVERCLEALERDDELAVLLAQRAESGEHERDLWLRVAQLRAGVDADAATAALERLAGEDDPHPQAVWALVASHAAAGRWSRVAELWTRLAGALPAEAPQRRALMLRIAALHELETDEHAEAATAYSAAMQPPGPAPGAAAGLARVHRGGGSASADDAEGLDQEIAGATDAAARFAVLLAAAEATRRAGADRDAVLGAFRRALAEAPDSVVGRRALYDACVDQGDFDAAAEQLAEGIAERAPEQQLALHDRLAEIHRVRGDLEQEQGSYRSMLEHEPDSALALRGVATALVAGGAWIDRPEALLSALTAGCERAREASDAASLWLELGRMRASSGHSGAALVEPMQAALDQDPQSLLALNWLIDAVSKTDDPARLALLHERLAEFVDTPIEKAALLTRVAELKGGDRELFRAALEADPAYLGAAFRIRDIALLDEDWETALRAVEAEVRSSGVQQNVVDAAMLAGALAADRLDDAERAVGHYRKVLELLPFNRAAFNALRGLFEARQRWSDLVELAEARIDVEPDIATIRQLHWQLARVASEQLKDRALARRHLDALLDLDAEDTEALSMLADLFEEQGQWPEAADALIRRARMEKDQGALRDLFMRLGVIYHERIPDIQRAVASFTKVVTLDPGNRAALQRLADLHLEELDFARALKITTRLLEGEHDPARQVDHLLRVAKIQEDGLKDPARAAAAFRKALELGPTDLRAIGALCGFYARQGDQRSVMVHLDRSVATMRARLAQDPFEVFAHHSLFQIFGWRKAPDGCLCAAQVLDALGQADAEEREFIAAHIGAVGTPGEALGALEHDDRMFQRGVPGGFRQIFRLLAASFGKIRRGDIRSHGLGRGDRLTDADAPIRRIGDALARDLGVAAYDLYLVKDNPGALIVENTEPPSVLIGAALVKDATEAELAFLMGRSLWIASRSMALSTRLRPEDLSVLISAVVRQYVPEFSPPGCDAKSLRDMTKQVAKILPRKLKQELMPFALECSGDAVDLHGVGASVIHSANRAGLLAARSVHAAVDCLRKAAGRFDAPTSPEQRLAMLRDEPEIEELLRFAVSDDHFELRRGMQISIR